MYIYTFKRENYLNREKLMENQLLISKTSHSYPKLAIHNFSCCKTTDRFYCDKNINLHHGMYTFTKNYFIMIKTEVY